MSPRRCPASPLGRRWSSSTAAASSLAARHAPHPTRADPLPSRQKVAREDPAGDFPIPQGRARLTVQAGLVGGKQPIASVADSTLAGVPVRTYVPASVLGQSARPTLVFFHGGGFIYGGEHSTHDAACRFLAEQAGVQVISVDYRMAPRSEEHTSELQSLMRISYAVFCLKKKKQT